MGADVWRLLDTGKKSAAENMAIDEAILEAHRDGHCPPTIRFYEWQPSTLSIGYFQRYAKEVRLDRVQEHGFQFVRRMTGGRAVLHDLELTYSVIVSETHPLMTSSVTDTYRIISSGLLAGFQHLGIPVSFSIPDNKENRALKQPRSAVCFDTPSWYELIVHGKKIVGSAQTRKNGVILQHGSILIDVRPDVLFDVLHFTNDRIRERMRQRFDQQTTTIHQQGISVNRAQLIDAFCSGFCEALQISLQSSGLSRRELERTATLASTKYASDEWNYGR